MKKILLPALVSGILLFGLSYLVMWFSIQFMPKLVEEFYNPIFYPGSDRAILFYIHPFVFALALSWFWNRRKGIYTGNKILQGIKFGIVYALVATLPAMWITFSSMDVTLVMVLLWWLYGLGQAMVAGIIFARMNP